MEERGRGTDRGGGRAPKYSGLEPPPDDVSIMYLSRCVKLSIVPIE